MTTAVNTKHNWNAFLKFYSELNYERPTRLGMFEMQSDGFVDYWIEDGLPLQGIDIDTHGDVPAIEIMLKDFEHVVRDVRSLKAHFSIDGSEDGLDITDAEGNTTILRFEQ